MLSLLKVLITACLITFLLGCGGGGDSVSNGSGTRGEEEVKDDYLIWDQGKWDYAKWQ